MDGGGTHIAVSLVDENENLKMKFEINTGVNLTSVNQERLQEIFKEIYSKTGKVRGIVVSFSGAGTQSRKIKLQSIIKEIFVVIMSQYIMMENQFYFLYTLGQIPH